MTTSHHVPPPGEYFNFAQHLLERNRGHTAKTAYIDDQGSMGYGALFDRIRPGIEIGYSMAEIQEGFGYKTASKTEDAMKDIEAAVKAVASAGKVGIVGYCWGGFLAWISAARVPGLAASAPYYGGGVPDAAGEQPKCPVMLHFGEKDSYIPMEGVAKLKAAHPTQTVHVYDVDHGFNCDQRGSWDEPSATLARQRTIEFFRKHIG